MKEDDMLLTIPEAAKVADVTRDTIYKAIRRGRLPFEKKYGKKLIPRPALEAWKNDPDKHRRGNPQFGGE